MFSFVWNFSIYCHLYPFNYKDESFYLSEYFDCRDKILKIDSIDASLKNFNYFCFHRNDGTLLHRACSFNLIHYCNILINKDDFDVEKYNAFKNENKKTPLDIAKEEQHSMIVSLMQVEFVYYLRLFCISFCILHLSLHF